MAQACRDAAVQPQVGDGGQFGSEQVVLHDVQHALQLAEDEHAVLAHHSLCGSVCSPRITQTAVQQQLRRETRRKTGQDRTGQKDRRASLRSSITCLRADSLGACWMSRKLELWAASSSVMRLYSGCCEVKTRLGWLHSFRRYCSACARTRTRGRARHWHQFRDAKLVTDVQTS